MKPFVDRFGWKPALFIFVLVVASYSLCAGTRLFKPSPHFHFVDLAHSFFDGRLDTDTPRMKVGQVPEDSPRGYAEAVERTLSKGGWNDWAILRQLTLSDGEVVRGRFAWEYEKDERRHLFHTTDNRELVIQVPQDLARTCGAQGRSLCDERLYYISFPPFPALIMAPFAAIWGYDTNDVIITVLCGGLNAVMMFWFLQLLVVRGHSKRSTRDNLWLTIAFALGTVAFFSSVRGEVWFSALIFGISLNISYMACALDLKHPVWAGVFLGLGFATRTPIAFCVAFFAWQLLLPNNRFSWAEIWERRTFILKKGMLFSAPILVILALVFWFNYSRFNSFSEFGHSYLTGSAYDRVRDYGMFSFAYLNRNLLSGLLAIPRFMSEYPYVMVSNHGLGLLFTTPLLAFLLWPREKPGLRLALWAAVAAAALPGFFYQNTGWVQFGYRFGLDFMPYLFALLAIGGRPINRTAIALIIWGIIVNLFGAITFGRYGRFYYETLFPGST